MKKALGCLSMAALAVVLAAPLPAQTIALRANVPFDFIVGGHTLSAGEYMFDKSIESTGVLTIRDAAGKASSMALLSPDDGLSHSRDALIVFHRYGSDYYLSGVWDGARIAGGSVPMTRSEREASKRASVAGPETVVVLARR